MPDILKLDLPREDDSDVEVPRDSGHGEQPIDDPPPAQTPDEIPAEDEDELQARESEVAFERALARFPAG